MTEKTLSGEVEGLKDGNGRPLRLYLVDGRPATDKYGAPLLNIAGNSIISVVKRNGTTEYCDTKGSLLTDMNGRTSQKPGYAPHESPAEHAQKRASECPVFALDGHPLTDSNGIPLVNAQGKPLVVFNPKGRPVTDTEGRDITDALGVVLNPKERPYLSKDKVPLRIFDELGRPLTDENGFPLTNIFGYPLILNDDYRNPVRTLKGYPVKDADGQMQWEEGFDLTKIPRYNIFHKAIICKNKEHGIAFDCFGHPLTDMYGFPFFDLEGVLLVKKKKIWVDSFKGPANVIHKSLYDKDALHKLRNSKGKAVQIYDRRGFPLVDLEGMPLVNSFGLLLINFNEYGEPVSDSEGYPTYDSRGNPFGSMDFRPCKYFGGVSERATALRVEKRGFQYYNVNGMPVTSCEGVPLLNSYQELMAKYDSDFIPLEDNFGNDVYDILSIPVSRNLSKPLLSPRGEAIRFYNKLGKPLTDRFGNVLRTIRNEPLLVVNSIGRIVSDHKQNICYDADGCPMNLTCKFLPMKFPLNEIWGKTLKKLDGTPIILYDITGEPLTDSNGGILLDSKGNSLVNYSQGGIIRDAKGEVIFDQEGNTEIKVAGRGLKDKAALYDKYDRPLIGPSGFVLQLRTGKEILKLDRYQFPLGTIDGGAVYDSKGNTIFTPLADMFVLPNFKDIVVLEGKIQLFDCEERPLLDITGQLLYTSKGIPLIQLTENGMPRCDALGRPIFDMRGIPVCNPGGVWRDRKGKPLRLYDKDAYPVTDPRGKELFDIRGHSLIQRNTFGHPKYDISGSELRDAKGQVMSSPSFNPTAVPPQSKTSSFMDSEGVPLKLFDISGRPLTDECGKSLETWKGKPLLDTTKGMQEITDLAGAPVYDLRHIPLGCNTSNPILTMDGKPIILYNKDGNPLMTSEGMPIKRWDGRTLLSFDRFGRPVSGDGLGLFDAEGNCVGSQDCVLTGAPCQKVSVIIEGRPVKVFDRAGRPLTDDKGNLLISSNGEPLQPTSWGDHLG